MGKRKAEAAVRAAARRNRAWLADVRRVVAAALNGEPPPPDPPRPGTAADLVRIMTAALAPPGADVIGAPALPPARASGGGR